MAGDNLRFIDFFSGIGGFRIGMEMAGHECVGHCEIDKFANKSYMAMHDVKEGEWFADDICRVEPGELPEAECWCGGFPCQSFSVAGKRAGFEDMRGTLIFEIFRLAAERKPEVIFLENVKGLLIHDGGRTFRTILNGFWQLGYDVQWSLLNSKNFGVAQKRERVFIIGSLGKRSRRKIFPITKANGKTVKQLIGGSQGYRVYDTNGLSITLASEAGGMGAKTGLYIIGKDGQRKDKDYASCLTGGGHSGGNHSDMDLLVVEQNFIDLTKGNVKITEDARALQARYNKGFSTRQGEISGVIQIYQKPRGYNEGGLKNTAPALTKNSYEQNNLVVQPVLTPDREEKRQEGRRFKEPGEEMFTLTAQDRHGVLLSEKETFNPSLNADGTITAIDAHYYKGHGTRGNKMRALAIQKKRIRRLTPRECFRLQGFSDEYFERAAKVNSDSQLYKQAGNTVTVNVIYEIAKRLNE